MRKTIGETRRRRDADGLEKPERLLPDGADCGYRDPRNTGGHRGGRSHRGISRGRDARLDTDRDSIFTSAARFWTNARPNVYPAITLDDTDSALRVPEDDRARLIDFDFLLPQDEDISFVPDFLKEVSDLVTTVSWRIDINTGRVFSADLDDPLPCQTSEANFRIAKSGDGKEPPARGLRLPNAGSA